MQNYICGYVGEKTMSLRINKHRSTIRTQCMDLPVSKHFGEAGHDVNHLKFWITDHVPQTRRGGDRTLDFKCIELECFYHFNSLAPSGLNRFLNIS